MVNRGVMMAFVGALRSGRYKQGKGFLRQNDYYCTMGVLCDLHAKAFGNQWEESRFGRFTYLGHEVYIPIPVKRWIGIDNSELLLDNNHSVVAMNDSDDATFDEIADAIEETYLAA